MNIWYSLIDILLPFQWTEYLFMKNAFIAVLLIAPIFGILSTMVVNNRMAFFSDSIGHCALTGVGIGAILGLKNPLIAMIVFAIAFAVFIVMVKNKNGSSTDTIIGVFSSTAVAFGLVLLSRDFNKYAYLLIGDLLSITPEEIGLLAGVFVSVIVLWIVMFNKLLIVSINPSLAGSRGIRVLWVEIFFTAVIAIVVMISIRWVGTLIINSLLLLPGAAARNISRNIRQYHIISLIIALFSGIAGLILSYYWGSATGPTITLICAMFYFTTFGLRNRFS